MFERDRVFNPVVGGDATLLGRYWEVGYESVLTEHNWLVGWQRDTVTALVLLLGCVQLQTRVTGSDVEIR